MFFSEFDCFISFNSRPHKEVDRRLKAFSVRFDLSIHDLTRRSTTAIRKHGNALNFQFTTSQGGRRSRRGSCKTRLTFQFTTSQGGRLDVLHTHYTKTSFNSRPHKEVDPGFQKNILTNINFQFTTSQGGRRRDVIAVADDIFFQFTTSQGGRLLKRYILTPVLNFQFTTSQGGRQDPHFIESYFPVFQFTTSQGGRRYGGNT